MKKIFIVVFFIILFILVFKDIFLTYFQQDEWHTFGIILSEGKRYVTMDQSPLQLLFSGDRVGARFIMYLMFSWFGLNITPYFVLSLGLHLINGLLIYKLISIFFTTRKIAYAAALFFLFNATASQSYTWLGTFAGSVPNMSALLLSLFSYLEFLRKQKKRFIYFSLALLWFSFLFKETGFFLLLLYPVIYFIYTKRILQTLKVNILFILYGIFLFILRINEILAPKGGSQNYFIGTENVRNIFLNAILYPLQGFSQLILPPNVIYSLSKMIGSFPFIGVTSTSEFADVFYQFKVAPIVSIVITFIFLFFIYKIFQSSSNRKYQKVVIFCLLFIFISFIPYFFVQRGGAYLESRYYYVGSLGSSILLGVVLILGLDAKRKFIKIATITFFFVLAYFHLASIKEDINFQKDAAIERKYIIKTIQDNVPRLPKKTIFYVSGDSGGYYGVENLKVPFQSGLGQTLLVRYVYDKQITPEFLHEDSILKTQGEGFLYAILDQDYKEINGRGFGYFWDKERMINAVRKYNLSSDSVFAFFYKSETQELINDTEQIRNEISID